MEDDEKKAKKSKRDERMSFRYSARELSPSDDDEKREKIARKASKRLSFLNKDIAPDAPTVEVPLLDDEGQLEKRSLFKGLFSNAAGNLDESGSESAIDDEIRADFQEILIDRIDDIEKELELPPVKDSTDAALASAEYLQLVGQEIEEGVTPSDAIKDAREAMYRPPQADATRADILNKSLYLDATAEETAESTLVENAQIEAATMNNEQSSRFVSSESSPLPRVAQSSDTIKMNEFYSRKRGTAQVMVGGMFGYLAGKGVNREKDRETEKDLTKKHKAELEGLRAMLYEQEAAVRADAQQEYLTNHIKISNELAQESIQHTSSQVRETVMAVAQPITVEKELIEQQEHRFEEALIQSDVEASKAPQEQEIITTETEAMMGNSEQLNETSSTEELSPKPKNKEAIEIASAVKKDVRNMTMPELLEAAEHIHFASVSLRELYEHNRIDAVNLRRVVIEYAHGGSGYEKLLRSSLEAVEMQRELRGEIKDDAAYHTKGVNDEQAILSQQDDRINGMTTLANDNTAQQLNEQSPPSDMIFVNNNTAVLLGVVAGVSVVALIWLYTLIG